LGKNCMLLKGSVAWAGGNVKKTNARTINKNIDLFIIPIGYFRLPI